MENKTPLDGDFLEDGMAFTFDEFNLLEELLSVGGRAGFYSTYYAMVQNLDPIESGAIEAALQSKIATFSDDVGACKLRVLSGHLVM